MPLTPRLLVAQTPACRLSRESRQAWRAINAVILAPRVASYQARTVAAFDRVMYPVVVNMGNPHFGEELLYEFGDARGVINDGKDIEWCLSPRANYDALGPEFMGDLVTEWDEPYWLKDRGRSGRGKIFVNDGSPCAVMSPTAITQEHFEGQEYRVNTYGDRVFQVHARYGTNGNRQYAWQGVQAMNDNGLIPFVKAALAKAYEHDNGGLTPDVLLAWDVMDTEDGWRVLEANSAPGMNEATVLRFHNLLMEGINA